MLTESSTFSYPEENLGMNAFLDNMNDGMLKESQCHPSISMEDSLQVHNAVATPSDAQSII